MDMFYYVDDFHTIPIDGEPVRDVEAYESANEAENLKSSTGIDRRSFEVSNFDDVEHEVSIAVSYEESDPSESIFERTLALGSHEGMEAYITRRKGKYTVMADLDIGPKQTFHWVIVENPAWYGIWIAITPGGDLITCGTESSDCGTTYPIVT